MSWLTALIFIPFRGMSATFCQGRLVYEEFMKKLEFRLFLAMLSVLLLSGSAAAKDWRGVVPLRSSRADIVRIFKKCGEPNVSCVFKIGNESTRIVFSGDAYDDFRGCPDQLPEGTVLLVQVQPIRDLQLKDLRINKQRLRSFDSSVPKDRSHKGYIDDREGLIIKTYEGKVLQMDYIAAARDRHLCPSYYENPEAFVRTGLFHHCPDVAIFGPSNEPRAGQEITFSADIPLEPAITFTWTVSAGRIVKGQGTRMITVDTAGLEGKTILATIELGGICPVKAHSQVHISPK